MPVNVGFVGMGSMGRMLVTALAGAGALQPGEIVVSNRSSGKLAQVAAAVPGILVAAHNADLAARCDTIFLCVKPAETATALTEMAHYISPEHLLVSITNTIDNATLQRAMRSRVAKVIPSVTQTVRDGVSLLIFGERCTQPDRDLLRRLMDSISRTFVIPESQARVASDLTSCGPAFFSYALRALAHAARQYQPDLPADTIDAMVLHTAQATCRLMTETGCSFDDVIARVSTPGGITAEGINILDEQMSGVWEQVIETTIIKEAGRKHRFEL